MPLRLNFHNASRSLALRSRPSIVSREYRCVQAASRRGFADEKDPKPAATGPNQDVLGHVSEEAAEMGDVTGETKRDLNQGTPVQEILKRDEEGKEKAPDVIKEEMDNTRATSLQNARALDQMARIAEGEGVELDRPGNKFGVPEFPLPPMFNLKKRYDPLVDQVTKCLMRDGKLGVAQRNMVMILNHLRIASPPTPNPLRPLLPGSPPPHHLPLDPIQYLTVAIDSVAPLIRIRQLRGMAGGGQSLQLPAPLNERQRRRTAIQWILTTIDKKPSRGSGRGMFAQKFADEVISVMEGKSSVWERRNNVHKVGTGARANLMVKRKFRR